MRREGVARKGRHGGLCKGEGSRDLGKGWESTVSAAVGVGYTGEVGCSVGGRAEEKKNWCIKRGRLEEGLSECRGGEGRMGDRR